MNFPPRLNLLTCKDLHEYSMYFNQGYTYLGSSQDANGDETYVFQRHPVFTTPIFKFENCTNDFVSIVELIGELSLGIDLPSPVRIDYLEPMRLSNPNEPRQVKTIAVDEVSITPIFEILYNKLKLNPKYNALRAARVNEINAQHKYHNIRNRYDHLVTYILNLDLRFPRLSVDKLINLRRMLQIEESSLSKASKRKQSRRRNKYWWAIRRDNKRYGYDE